MNKKAIKIDLSTFFDDERKMSCILVDPNWKSVACLQKRVELLFDVESVQFLSDGCFLPPQESIEIIKYCNDIKAFVPNKAIELRKGHKSKKRKNSKESGVEEIGITEFELQKVHDIQKKRKLNSLENDHNLSSYSIKAKRSKNSNKNVFLEITNATGISMPECLQIPDDIESKKAKMKNSTALIDSSCGSKSKVAENISNSGENTMVSRCTDGQHKDNNALTLKERSTLQTAESIVDKTMENESETQSTCHSIISSSTFINQYNMPNESANASRVSKSQNANNPFLKSKPNRVHIYFDETGDIVSSTNKSSKTTPKEEKEAKTIVIFRCPLTDITSGIQPQKPRIFHLKSKNIRNNTAKKQIVEIQEEIILPPHPILNKLNLINKTETEQIEVDKQKETNESSPQETDKTDKQVSPNNTTIAESPSIAKNVDEEEISPNNLEVSHNKETNCIDVKQEPSTIDQASVMSVDCVDLSIDLDDENAELQKKEKTVESSISNSQDKGNLIANDGKNNSSASDIEEISEIIDLNESEDTTQNDPLKNMRISKILPFCKNFTGLPETGDIIVFKVAYMKKNKYIANTKYMAGKVEYINRRTKSIKILITDGFPELEFIPNQLICALDDSRNPSKYLQLKLNNMRAQKLFSKP